MTAQSDTDAGAAAGREIRVIVVDDQALVRAGLVALIELEDDMCVVGQGADGGDAVALARKFRPDVALLDIEMGESSGIDAAARIRGAGLETRCLMVTSFGRPGYLASAMAAGADGFIVKDTPGPRLVDAVRRLAAGLRVVDPELAAEAMALGPSPLTEREQEVLRAAAHGGTVAAIARVVCLAEGTVRNHLSSAMAKLGARTRAEAYQRALEVGWL